MYKTLAVVILVAVDQININIVLLNQLFLITFTVLLAGFILLLIFASHTIAKEMIYTRFISEIYVVDQEISVGEFGGIIEAIKSTSIHLKTDGKTIILPAKFFLENPVTVLSDFDSD